MPKISKRAMKQHNLAMEMVNSTDDLSLDDRIFIMENYHPGATNNVGWAGIFFTPQELAREAAIEYLGKAGKRTLDLCAGIGTLTFHAIQRHLWNDDTVASEFVCIEQNPEFIEVGRRVVPEATWIRGDVFEPSTYNGIGEFNEIISNPPYGLRPKQSWLTKALSQYMIAEIAMKLADHAVFILSQGDLPFKFSGSSGYQTVEQNRYEAWSKKTGIDFRMGCGIDTSIWRKSWQFLSDMVTEVTLVEKSEFYQAKIGL